MYGVEMETNTEYQYQRPAIAFWIGVALGRGIQVDAHTSIFDDPLYGYEGKVTVDYEEFGARAEQYKVQCAAELEQFEAARDETNKAIAHYANYGDGYEEMLNKVQRQAEIAAKFGAVDGARQENERYQKKIDTMREHADGKYMIVRQEFEQAAAALGKEHYATMNNAAAMAGQMEVYLSATKNVKNQQRRRERVAKFVMVMNAFVAESTKSGMYQGAMVENHHFIQKLDKLIRAAGGSKSEAVLIEAGAK